VQTDVTEIVETQLRIQDALQLAQNANQMKNRFISMVSHEFRTPLAVIRSTAETLRDFYDRMNAEQRLRRFMTIDAQIARIGAMLEDLLTLGKLESSSVTLSQELLDLNTWLDSLLEEFVAAHQTHRIATQIEQELLVVADRTLLRQILTNLLSNAIKYSGASNLVELKVWKVDRELWMEVRDYGIGIPTEDLDHLFTEFKRASNVGTIQGTGLGLVIVHRAVSLQGGTIDIQSTLGTGTTVTISMPVIHHD
jgi:signal transduction histidine kinase